MYRASRTVQGCKTHYNELIALIDANHRVRTTQLFEDGVYKLVTMIEESKVEEPKVSESPAASESI